LLQFEGKNYLKK